MTNAKLNKKSMAFSVIIMLIVAIVAGIVLFAAGMRFNKLAVKKTDVEVCRLSMMINSKIDKTKLSLIDNTPIQCISQEYTPKDGSTAEDDINMVAEQLDNCRYKMGGGEFPAPSKYFTEDQRNCIVCSEFTVNNDLAKDVIFSTVMARKSKWDSKKQVSEYLGYLDSAYLNIMNENGQHGAVKKSSKNSENRYLVIFWRYEPNKMKVAAGINDQGYQKVYIVHEKGLVNLPDGSGVKCDQLLWEKKRKGQ